MNENYKFNGKNFDKVDGNNGYIVTDFDWHSGINQSDTIKRLGGVQGVYSSATFIRGRNLVIEGKIVAEDEAGLLTYIKELKRIFFVEWIPQGEGTKELEITDENGSVWVANARVKDLPSFKTDGNIGEYRATMFLSNALYKSKDSLTFNGDEGIMSGLIFPTTFSTASNKKQVSVKLLTDTSFSTPLEIIININGDIEQYLKVLNATNGDYFQINKTFSDGDVIKIDCDKKTVTNNGVSIIGFKDPNSSWLYINENTDIVATDGDLNGDFSISVSFKDILL